MEKHLEEAQDIIKSLIEFNNINAEMYCNAVDLSFLKLLILSNNPEMIKHYLGLNTIKIQQ